MSITTVRLRELIDFAADKAADTTQPYADLMAYRDMVKALEELLP